MKNIILIIVLFSSTNILGQYGLDKTPKVHPSPEWLDSRPYIEYFNRFGKSYIQIDSGNGFGYYKSMVYTTFFKRCGNRVRGKTISSKDKSTTIRKYRIIDNYIIEKRHYRNFKHKKRNKGSNLKEEVEVIGNDSLQYSWWYQYNKKDSTIWKSTRKLYNKKGQLLRYENVWNVYAKNDSTWALAEKDSTASHFERISYEYLSDNTIKVISETIKSKKLVVNQFTLTFLCDSNGNVTEQHRIYKDSQIDYYDKFYYDNGLCIVYESGDSFFGKTEKIIVRKK